MTETLIDSVPGDAASLRRRAVWRWAIVSLVFALGMTAAKWAAFALTLSAAVLSDAVESFVNILSSSFVLYAIWLSNRPRDDEHPYGHGKVEYFSAGFEGALVLFAAISVALVGIQRLVVPVELERLGLGVALELGISVVTLVVGQLVLRAGKTHQSPAIIADGIHIRADAITSVGVAAGMAATLLTGFAWLDAAVALGIGVWLFGSGISVVREAVGGLMDEADPEVLDEIAEVLTSVRQPGWVAPHHGKVHRLGRTIHIDLHMVFPAYWTIERVHDDATVIDRALVEAFGPGSEVMLHMESCTPRSCSYCDAPGCPIRQTPLVRTREWTGEHIASRARPSPLLEDQEHEQ